MRDIGGRLFKGLRIKAKSKVSERVFESTEFQLFYDENGDFYGLIPHDESNIGFLELFIEEAENKNKG